MKFALFAAALISLPIASAESAKDVWEGLLIEKLKKHPAFAYVEPDSKLPAVDLEPVETPAEAELEESRVETPPAASAPSFSFLTAATIYACSFIFPE